MSRSRTPEYRIWVEAYQELCRVLTIDFVNDFCMVLPSVEAFNGGSQVAVYNLEILEQFTGLYDSKRTVRFPEGQKIFENDIIDGMVVTYCGDQGAGLGMTAGWYLQRDNFERWVELEARSNENGNNYFVTGNIHEGTIYSPHTLEEG